MQASPLQQQQSESFARDCTADEEGEEPFNVTTVSQMRAYEAIKGQNCVRSIRNLVEHEGGKIRDSFFSLGIKVYGSRSNFFLIEAGQWCNRVVDALQSRGVCFKCVSDPDYGGCLRVAVRSSSENNEMLARFSDVLSGLGLYLPKTAHRSQLRAGILGARVCRVS